MRLWSFDPRHLDRMGLLAEWREALLAQKVLAGRTRGYRFHPQLERFKALDEPVAGIGAYLAEVRRAAQERGYEFNGALILLPDRPPRGGIEVAEGQLAFEWSLFLAKVASRDPPWWRDLALLAGPRPHPLVKVVAGGIASWERMRAAP